MSKKKGKFECLLPMPDLGNYVGKWVGIVDNRVVSSGKNGKEVFAEVKAKYPNSTPMLLKVPTDAVTLL